jgi:hypothetical protein
LDLRFRLTGCTQYEAEYERLGLIFWFSSEWYTQILFLSIDQILGTTFLRLLLLRTILNFNFISNCTQSVNDIESLPKERRGELDSRKESESSDNS